MTGGTPRALARHAPITCFRTAAGSPDSTADAPDQEIPVRCPDTGVCVTAWLEQSLRDLPGTVLAGGREFRPLYLEEARALGYADSDPAVLLRREDDGTVFEVSIAVTARVVRREVRGFPDAGGGGRD